MKKILFTLLPLLFILSAKAQKRDTTVYKGCRLIGDTTQYVSGGQQVLFDSCPRFKHGMAELSHYLSTHTRFKEITAKNARSRVYVAFIIEKDGSISKAKVVDGLSSTRFRKEALRVIRNMPKWRPAILHGKPVRMWDVLPVDFRRF